jgi:hypothetical protein
VDLGAKKKVPESTKVVKKTKRQLKAASPVDDVTEHFEEDPEPDLQAQALTGINPPKRRSKRKRKEKNSKQTVRVLHSVRHKAA